MKILFITPRYPFPLLSGDRVRAYHQISELAKEHEVFLLSPPPQSEEAELALKNAVGHRVHVSQSRVRAAARIMRGAFMRTPLQTLAFADREYRREAINLIEKHGIELAHVQLVRLAPVLDGVAIPKFMDFVDALSVNMTQMAARSRGPKRFAAKLESSRLHHYEQKMVQEYDAGGITSSRDRLALGNPENMFVIPQGVRLQDGAPEERQRPPARIIFTGRMSYFPNEDAACWFVNEVFPMIRQEIPEAEFVIAGADPGPRVKSLAEESRVSVLGFVDSITEELLNSTVAIVPMKSGTGMQTKIVEAMAAGTPIVITPEGLGSLDLRDGVHLSLANGAEEFSKAVVQILRDKRLAFHLAQNARREVELKYSWIASTRELMKGYEYAQSAFDHRCKLL